ncbi:NAD(P)-dependent dehydrogenase (short-subunit alcohol dehydrogenase family) [Variovorax boronicumulans]
MTSNRLQNKTILVTAAAQGIGLATALACAREGAQVIATDINVGLLDKLAHASTGIRTAVLDVRSADAIAALAAKLPALDGLFNCVGYVHHGSVLDGSDIRAAMKADPEGSACWKPSAQLLG